MLRRSTMNLCCALGLVGGIALRSWFEIPLSAGYILGCAGVIAVVLGWKKERVKLGGLAALFLFLGIWRTDVALRPPSLQDISHWAGQAVTVEGVVARDPEVRMKTVKAVVEVKGITQQGTNNNLQCNSRESGKSETKRKNPFLFLLRNWIPDQVGDDSACNHKGIVKGNLLVVISAVHVIEVGDVLRFKCMIEKPEYIEEFNYPRYLAKDGMYATCTYPDILSRSPGIRGLRWALARLKHDFQSSLQRVVPEPESAFLGGILVGSRGRIPESVLKDFQRIGITHLIAISGYNITVIATGVLALLTLFLRRHTAFPFLVLIIAAFTVMVGGSASVVRAAIMGLLLHAAYVSDRLYRSAYGLVLAAAVMLMVNPRLLRDDLGFDLSFLATWGIMTLTPWFTKKFSWMTDRWHIREALAMTCAAQVTTLPLLVGSFDRVSLIAPFANVIIVPTIPFVMVLGFAAGIAGVIPVIGLIVGKFAWLAGFAVLEIAHALARVPAASITVAEWMWAAVVAAYAVILLSIWQKTKVRYWIGRIIKKYRHPAQIMQSKESIRAMSVETEEVRLDDVEIVGLTGGSHDYFGATDRISSKASGDSTASHQSDNRLRLWFGGHRVLTGAIALVVIFVAASIPSYLHWQRFSVTIFDIGQGDAILVAAPHGQQMLIDGGPDAAVLSKLGRAMPWWDRTIEMIVLTHPHADHVTGLVEVIKRYKIRKVVMTGVAHTAIEYTAFLSAIANRVIPVEIPHAGDTLTLGPVTFAVLAPLESLQDARVDDLNESSLVLQMKYGETVWLFMGDATAANEETLVESFGDDLKSDVLKVGHHGSAYSSSDGFLHAVEPRYTVISVGENNSYGHPSLRTLKRLERVGAKVLRTDKEGDVRFVINNGVLQAQ